MLVLLDHAGEATVVGVVSEVIWEVQHPVEYQISPVVGLLLP